MKTRYALIALLVAAALLISIAAYIKLNTAKETNPLSSPGSKSKEIVYMAGSVKRTTDATLLEKWNVKDGTKFDFRFTFVGKSGKETQRSVYRIGENEYETSDEMEGQYRIKIINYDSGKEIMECTAIQ